MNNTKRLFLLTFIFIFGLCKAQDTLPVISADRPGYTWGTEVMHHHKIAWENGFGYESVANGPKTTTLDAMMIRYGIFKNVELRASTNFLMWKDEEAMEPSFGISPLTLGTKIKIYDGTNILPSIGLLAEFKSPHVGTKSLLPSHLAPALYVLFENDINDWFSICYNVGAEWDGENATPTKLLSLSLGFNITNSVGTFIETVNYFHPEGNDYLTEFGITWLVSRKVQLDLAGDLYFKDFGKHYAITGGVAWMIN